jgi:arylsulfatase A-like enzyme
MAKPHPILSAFLCVLCASAVNRPVFGADKPDKPNILYILSDDFGFGDLACQNPNSKIATPNLDRLAAEGIRFSDCHDPTSVCTPTRYGVLTGRYCWRSTLKRGVLLGFSAPLIEPGRLTVPAMLKQQGYATAAIGKWHLGMTWPVKPGQTPRPAGPPAGKGKKGKGASADAPELDDAVVDFTRPIKDGPTTRGFDYFFGISASLDMPPYVFIENDHVTAQPTERQERLQGQYVRAGPKAPGFQFDQVLPTLTDKAVGYIGERATKKEPFFLYLALNAPHTPIAPAAQWKGKSQAGDYGDYVMEVDAMVARVLAALQQHNLADNTLVIFTSDNGPEVLAYARAQQYHHYSMGDWRGVKRDAWEGGHRVPFLARWPGHIKPNSTSNEIICLTDLMATAAAITGFNLPETAAKDSYNILPALLGQHLDHPIRQAIVHHSAKGTFAIRQGNWVLIDGPTGDDNREPDWLKQERHYTPHTQPGELHDLSTDPAERNNLYADHPDIVAKLKTLLEKYKSEGRSAPKVP